MEEATTIRQIDKFYPELDEERMKDVAKYLRVVTRDIALLASFSPKMKKQMEQRMKRKLIKVFNKKNNADLYRGTLFFSSCHSISHLILSCTSNILIQTLSSLEL